MLFSISDSSCWLALRFFQLWIHQDAKVIDHLHVLEDKIYALRNLTARIWLHHVPSGGLYRNYMSYLFVLHGPSCVGCENFRYFRVFLLHRSMLNPIDTAQQLPLMCVSEGSRFVISTALDSVMLFAVVNVRAGDNRIIFKSFALIFLS